MAESTRSAIVMAGTALAREASGWDWRNLTARAVAEKAGVSERTIYRHFASERQLHDSIMHRLEQEAGVVYEGIRLEDVARVTARVFSAVPAFSVPPPVIHDETFMATDLRRQKALVDAVRDTGADWPDAERRMAAAVLDVLWVPTTYERLVTSWHMDAEDATRAMMWAIELVVETLRAGKHPTHAGK